MIIFCLSIITFYAQRIKISMVLKKYYVFMFNVLDVPTGTAEIISSSHIFKHVRFTRAP